MSGEQTWEQAGEREEKVNKDHFFPSNIIDNLENILVDESKDSESSASH